MINKPYASVIGSLMYAQVCTVLIGRYLSNQNIDH